MNLKNILIIPLLCFSYIASGQGKKGNFEYRFQRINVIETLPENSSWSFNNVKSVKSSSGKNNAYRLINSRNIGTMTLNTRDYPIKFDRDLEISFTMSSETRLGSSVAGLRLKNDNNSIIGMQLRDAFFHPEIHVASTNYWYSGTKVNAINGQYTFTIRKIKKRLYLYCNKKYIGYSWGELNSISFLMKGHNSFGSESFQLVDLKVDYLLDPKKKKKGVHDNEPPVIIVTNPSNSNSRNYNVVSNNQYKIEGHVYDNRGISRFTINNVPVRLLNNQFNYTLSSHYKSGSKVTLVATDINGLTSKKILTFNKSNPTPNPVVSNQTKVALVIGNSSYYYGGKLGMNPINDADDMAWVLRSLGFKVILEKNGSRDKMQSAISRFSNASKDADIALFYFAGHGLQSENKNYLIPVDAKINRKADLAFQGISVDAIQQHMEATDPNRLNILILDACRNNPFQSWSRSAGNGLAEMMPPSGTLLAYSTAPGTISQNGNGRNGLYTGELLKQLKIPQRIEDVFINTRIAVEDKTNGNQKPWELARLRGAYWLKVR